MLPIIRKAFIGAAFFLHIAVVALAGSADSLLQPAAAGDALRHNAGMRYYRSGIIDSAAIAYYRAFNRAKGSFTPMERSRQLSELQLKYETTRTQRENETLAYREALAGRRRMMIRYVSLGVILALGSIFSLVYRNRRVRDRLHEERHVAQAIIESEQRERIRIARDLHDSIGQMLAALRIQLSAFEADVPGDLKKRVSESAALADRTASEIRAISHNLIPEELSSGFASAVRALCEKISTAGSLQVFAEIDEPLRQKKLPVHFELSLYRITQEILTGIIRHAAASIIRIRAEQEHGGLRMMIQANGRGFDRDRVKDSEGLGWKYIAARVRLLQGIMEVSGEHEHGTQVTIRVPFPS